MELSPTPAHMLRQMVHQMPWALVPYVSNSVPSLQSCSSSQPGYAGKPLLLVVAKQHLPDCTFASAAGCLSCCTRPQQTSSSWMLWWLCCLASTATW